MFKYKDRETQGFALESRIPRNPRQKPPNFWSSNPGPHSIPDANVLKYATWITYWVYFTYQKLYLSTESEPEGRKGKGNQKASLWTIQNQDSNSMHIS